MRNIYGSDNGMWHVQRQNIIWTNDRLLLTGPLGKMSDFEIKFYIFILENKLENIVCQMAAILSSLQYINKQLDKQRMGR